MDQKKTTHFPGWNRHSLHENELNDQISLVGTGILSMKMNLIVTFPWLKQPFFTWEWTEWSHFPGWSRHSLHEDGLSGHISWLEQEFFTWEWTGMVTFPWLEQSFFPWGWTKWSHFPGWNRHSLHENELNGHISQVQAAILYMRMNWMITFPWLEQTFFTRRWTEWSHFPGSNRHSLHENELNDHISLVGTGILSMRMN